MIAAAPSKVVYQGDAVTTVFGFSMPLPAGSTGSEIQVWIFDNLNPQNATLLTSNYSVNVAAGTVTFPTVGGVAPLAPGVNALPVGWQIVLARNVPMSQLLSVLTQGIFDGPSFEAAFDRLDMICQQLAEQVGRCFQLPINQTPSVASVTVNGITITTGTLLGAITLSNTYANLKANPPAAFTLAWATDIGAGAMMFYTGNPVLGDGGWLGPMVGASV